MKITSKLGLIFIATFLASNSTPVIAQIIPTNEWVNLFSSNTTLDGSSVPVGAVVNAYDPDGVWCGTFTVHTEGEYGFLLVYRDDTTTPDVDEGASPGDTIIFHINGHLAIPLGPGAPVWTANGDIIQLNLEGHFNYDPAITSTADTAATEDQLYSYSVIATDIDGDTLTYSLTIQPSWLSVDSVSGVISGTPTNDDVGDTVVSVVVEDGQGGQDTQTYTLHVLNINDPPVITTASLSDAIEDVAYSDSVVASDVDIGDTLTFSLLIYPSWLSINDSTGVLSGTPTNDDVGSNIQIKVRVNDLIGASDTLDTYIDVRNMNDPPVISDFPDSITFRSDTTHSINLNDYVEDADDPDLSLHWSVAGNDSVAVTIDPSTNIAELSASSTFSGKDTLVFTVADDSSAWDNDTLMVHVIPYIRTVTIPLDAGWNLISWDVDTPNDSAAVLLSDIMVNVAVVLGFEAGGLTYDPDLPQFSNLQLMDHLHGYWIKMVASDTLFVTGATVEDDTPIPLEAGWNLVSYLPDDPDSVAHALGNILDKVIVVLGFDEGGLTYDPDLPEFSNLLILSPGFGYWIKMTSADTLIYPDTQVATGLVLGKRTARISTKSSVVPTNEWVSVFGEGVILKGHPLKVGSVIQAKDADGVICGEVVVEREGRFGMMPVYRDDPWTELDEGAELGDEIRIYIGGVEINASITWGGFGEVYKVGLTPLESSLPTFYTLSQNHPNPFNPVTKILYQLPQASEVSLIVFNILGQNIRTLIDGQIEAGYHSVYWDGKNDRGEKVTSGVYFSWMKAGKFVKTRKMIILR